jgi:hypothetical protein
MPFTGEVTRLRSYSRGVSGGISFIGNIGTEIPQAIQQLIEGALSFAGGVSLKRRYKRSAEGLVTFVGNIGEGARFKRSIDGALTFIGNMSSLASQKLVEGILRFSGKVTRVVNGIPIKIGGIASIVLTKIKGMFLDKDIHL